MQTQVAAIKHAVQGPFEINDVDESSPDRKIVRVVTTVDFYLKLRAGLARAWRGYFILRACFS